MPLPLFMEVRIFLTVKIQGYSEEDMMYDVMLVLKSRTEVPYATYAPGHYYGVSVIYLKGILHRGV